MRQKQDKNTDKMEKYQIWMSFENLVVNKKYKGRKGSGKEQLG